MIARVLAGSVTLAFLAWYTPPAKPRFLVCGFHWLTGHPCPLCGMTRAMFSLAKGDLQAAVHFNALSPLVFAMLCAVFFVPPFTRSFTNHWQTFGLAILTAYGVLRLCCLVP